MDDKRNIPKPPRKIPMPDVKAHKSSAIGELEVTVELKGYDKIKQQLNDIESQLDRIIEKQIHIETLYNDNTKELSNVDIKLFDTWTSDRERLLHEYDNVAVAKFEGMKVKGKAINCMVNVCWNNNRCH